VLRHIRFQSRHFEILVAGLLAALGLATWVGVSRADQRTPARTVSLPAEALSLRAEPTDGSDEAPLALIIYSDFQCPFCAVFARTVLPTLRSQYVIRNRLLLVFRHFPLETIHSRAVTAAVLSECANKQGRFWQLHDSIFAGGIDLSSVEFHKLSVAAGMDPRLLEGCYLGADGPALARTIRQDAAEAATLGVFATPTFLVGTIENGRRVRVKKVIQGAQPYGAFSSVIDAMLTSVAGHK